MLGRTLSRALLAFFLIIIVAVAPMCVWHRHRSVAQIESISTKFIGAASKFDLMTVRDCIADEGRASMPAYYTSVIARKLQEINRDVKVSVRLKAVDVKMNIGYAKVIVKREVTERGIRLGKPVNTRIDDTCTVFCVFDGKRWLVDFDRTLKDKHSPVANFSLFKEYRIK